MQRYKVNCRSTKGSDRKPRDYDVLAISELDARGLAITALQTELNTTNRIKVISCALIFINRKGK